MKYLLILTMAVATQAACPFGGKFQKMGSETDCPHMKAKQVRAATPQMTSMGCVCKTNCKPGVTDLYNCDWCYTEGSCGKSGLKGKYDYCVYPENKDYEYQTLNEKMDNLWTEIDADHKSGTYPSVLGALKESVQTTFDARSDVMPAGRVKYIHGVGAVCKFNLKIAGDSPFTGVLKANNVAHGLIRMGSALAVDLDSGIVPGLGIKFLRSKVPSGNFVALNSLTPLPDKSYNFFEQTFSNHIGPAEGVASFLAKKFEQKSSCATQVGVSDICKYDNDGVETDDLKFPFEITLNSRNIQFPTSPVTGDALMDMLTSIPTGTDLFEVGYYTDPKAAQSGAGRILGTMTTDGPCVASAFGDASLFFRHQLIEEDWKLQPTWPGYLTGTDCSSSSAPKISNLPSQCPARIFEFDKTEQL